jgi:hypothetical protein
LGNKYHRVFSTAAFIASELFLAAAYAINFAPLSILLLFIHALLKMPISFNIQDMEDIITINPDQCGINNLNLIQ